MRWKRLLRRKRLQVPRNELQASTDMKSQIPAVATAPLVPIDGVAEMIHIEATPSVAQAISVSEPVAEIRIPIEATGANTERQAKHRSNWKHRSH